METLSTLLMLAATGLFIFLLVKMLAAPIKLIFKLAIHAALGFGVLFLANHFGAAFGVSIPITLITALITGFGGIPGVLFLVLLQILF